MQRRRDSWLAGSIAAAALLLAPEAVAQQSEASFYRAYYLEHEAGDLEGALALYEKVAADKRADGELRQRARESAVAISEDLLAGDFARLMPPDTIFYAEINRPGERLAALCDQLGLLGGGGGQLGVSPLLIESVLGMRGAAVGITAIDPASGEPNGVAILHPGDLDLARGLIETAVPGGGVRVDDIAGYPTWNIDGECFVSLTSRLAVASPDPAQVAGVLRRIAGKERSSLAAHPGLRSAMESRGEDLVFFCLNAEPVMPMIEGLIQQEIGDDREAQLAVALLDVDSLRSVAGRIGVGEQGLGLDLAVQLADDHTNIAFNLMRTPHLDERTFSLVPEGAAFFLATAFNEPAEVAPAARGGQDQAVVTFMDFGRELFGNLVDVAIFGVPTAGGGEGLPDVAAVVRVNDVERSRALWDLCLGVASQASGAQPEHVKIAGTDAERFTIEGVPVYLVTGKGELLISPSRKAIAHTLDARRSGRTIVDDPIFGESVACIDPDSTFALMANPGRLAKMAAAFIPASEREQVMQMAHILAETVLCLDTDQSSTRLAYHARVHHVPDVSGLVEHALESWKGASPRRAEISAANGSEGGYGRPREAGGKLVASEPARTVTRVVDDPAALAKEFQTLVAHGDYEAAGKVGEAYVKAVHDDPIVLNQFAWNLLTKEGTAGRFAELALAASKRSNALTDHGNWMYVDTLALAVFENGDVEKAIALQRQAIELAGDDPRAGEAVVALKRFEKAAKAAKTAKQEQKKPRGISDEEYAAGEQHFIELVAAERYAEAREFALGLLVIEDATVLNDTARQLLTGPSTEGHFDAVALKLAARANELTEYGNWALVDTLALATFRNGDVEKAVKLQQKAVILAAGDPRASEAETALVKYVAAAKEGASHAKKEPVYGAEKSGGGDKRAELEKSLASLAREGRHDEAKVAGKKLLASAKDDAFFLNNLAWKLLTEDPYAGRYDSLARAMAERSNEVSKHGNWFYLDTLALAAFRTGEVAKAVELERLAVKLAADDPRADEARQALARFEAALADSGAPRREQPAEGHGKALTDDEIAEMNDRFEELAAEHQYAAAAEIVEGLVATDDPDWLNVLAWTLLTEEPYKGHYAKSAVKLSKRSNELTNYENWFYLDTLALAAFETGEVEAAVELGKKAVAAGGDDPRVGEAADNLKRFQAALGGKAQPKKPKASAPASLGALREEFDVLATKKKQRAGALGVGKRIAELAGEDATYLNNFAWALLTEGRYDDQYDEFAWKLADRANEVAGFTNWLFVDTLALAVFKSGDVAKAIELERLALKMAGDDPQRGEAEAALKRYEKALETSGGTIGGK